MSMTAANTTNTQLKSDPSIYNPDGTIITGHIPNWRNLTKADRQIVHAERKRLGVSKNKNSDDNKKSAKQKDAANANRLKQLSDSNKGMKRQIKALKRSSTSNGDDNADSDSDTDAGDQFGGKAAKKKQKKN